MNAPKANVIGVLRNNWRGRLVTVYETNDPTKVRTVGVPLDGKGPTVDVIEDRQAWERTIALFPKTAIYD